MIIGFTSHLQRVSEAQALEDKDNFLHTVDISSPAPSEISYIVLIRLQESRNAQVIAISALPFLTWDAAFGYNFIEDGYLTEPEEVNTLFAGLTRISLAVMINNDVTPEDDNECFTLQIVTRDEDRSRAIPECDAVVNGTQYYCSHTICIDDDDGEYNPQSYFHNHVDFCIAVLRLIHTKDLT